jgi:hypothetical protein
LKPNVGNAPGEGRDSPLHARARVPVLSPLKRPDDCGFWLETTADRKSEHMGRDAQGEASFLQHEQLNDRAYPGRISIRARLAASPGLVI